MKSIAFFNNKGGVGKTTLACNLVSYMNDSLEIDRSVNFTKKEKVPAWL